MRAVAWLRLAAAATLAGCAASEEPALPAAPHPQALVAAAPAVVAAPVATPPVVQERRVLLTVQFALNRHDIAPASRPLIDNLAAALRDPRLAAAAIEVNGHTDASGRLAHNIALSFLRASAVVEALHARGVAPAGGIRAQGFGPLQPLDAAQPLHATNRRVEVVATLR